MHTLLGGPSVPQFRLEAKGSGDIACIPGVGVQRPPAQLICANGQEPADICRNNDHASSTRGAFDGSNHVGSTREHFYFYLVALRALHILTNELVFLRHCSSQKSLSREFGEMKSGESRLDAKIAKSQRKVYFALGTAEEDRWDRSANWEKAQQSLGSDAMADQHRDGVLEEHPRHQGYACK